MQWSTHPGRPHSVALVETNPSESHAEPYKILQTLNVSPESIVLKAGQVHATVVGTYIP